MNKIHHKRSFQKKTSQFHINPEDSSKYFAVWAAILPAYNTTKNDDNSYKGIHVHQRSIYSEVKSVDRTFKEVYIKLNSSSISQDYIKLADNAALAYRAGIVLNKPLKYLSCPYCLNYHLDTNFFSVNLHKKHLCEVCKKTFLDAEPSISNPILFAQEALGVKSPWQHTTVANKSLVINQKEFLGGMKIWGSAPAILWHSPIKEESGIHIHTFDANNQKIIDDTFDYVEIDGYILDVKMVQYYTAQNSLPYLAKKLSCLFCPRCNKAHFDRDDNATTPHDKHVCEHCGYSFTSPMNRKTISNPFVYLKETLLKNFCDSSC